MLTNLLIKIGVNLVMNYINSTKSTKDDEVLKIVQNGAKYLSCKTNNNLCVKTAENLSKIEMK